jgi:hypothetical protein
MTFENMSALKVWDEQQRCHTLRASVQGYAVSCLASIDYGPWAAVAAVPAGPGIAAVVAAGPRAALTSHEILDAYEAKFVTASNSTYARQSFLDAAQQEGEPLVQWHTRILMLYRQSEANADLENTKELREHFTRGLINKRVKEHVMDSQPLTMTNALQLATAKAATIEVLRKEGPRGLQQQGKAPGLFALDLRTERRDVTSSLETRRCYNCDKTGHLKRGCRQPLNRKDSSGKQRQERGGAPTSPNPERVDQALLALMESMASDSDIEEGQEQMVLDDNHPEEEGDGSGN